MAATLDRLARAPKIRPLPAPSQAILGLMRRTDVTIPMPDGHAAATVHVPDGTGPWPGVLLFPDAGGARETMREMADHIAAMGYVAMVLDIYYRAGDWEPFDVATFFTDENE